MCCCGGDTGGSPGEGGPPSAMESVSPPRVTALPVPAAPRQGQPVFAVLGLGRGHGCSPRKRWVTRCGAVPNSPPPPLHLLPASRERGLIQTQGRGIGGTEKQRESKSRPISTLMNHPPHQTTPPPTSSCASPPTMATSLPSPHRTTRGTATHLGTGTPHTSSRGELRGDSLDLLLLPGHQITPWAAGPAAPAAAKPPPACCGAHPRA